MTSMSFSTDLTYLHLGKLQLFKNIPDWETFLDKSLFTFDSSGLTDKVVRIYS